MDDTHGTTGSRGGALLSVSIACPPALFAETASLKAATAPARAFAAAHRRDV